MSGLWARNTAAAARHVRINMGCWRPRKSPLGPTASPNHSRSNTAQEHENGYVRGTERCSERAPSILLQTMYVTAAGRLALCPSALRTTTVHCTRIGWAGVAQMIAEAVTVRSAQVAPHTVTVAPARNCPLRVYHIEAQSCNVWARNVAIVPAVAALV